MMSVKNYFTNLYLFTKSPLDKSRLSLMCMDFLHIHEQIETLNGLADYYHIDIMDGHFAKNLSLSPDFMKAVAPAMKLPMDVHLMTDFPDDWIENSAKAGAEYISPHAETINKDAFRILDKIEKLGCKKGVTLNPATPLSYISQYMSRLDMITIMTVDVGFAGQKFIPEMLDKIAEAKRLRDENDWHYKIMVDGSCNVQTFRRLYEAGVDVFVVGSSGLFNLNPNVETAFSMMFDNFEKETGHSPLRRK